MEVQICIRRTQDVQGNADAALPGLPLPVGGWGVGWWGGVSSS